MIKLAFGFNLDIKLVLNIIWYSDVVDLKSECNFIFAFIVHFCIVVS